MGCVKIPTNTIYLQQNHTKHHSFSSTGSSPVQIPVQKRVQQLSTGTHSVICMTKDRTERTLLHKIEVNITLKFLCATVPFLIFCFSFYYFVCYTIFCVPFKILCDPLFQSSVIEFDKHSPVNNILVKTRSHVRPWHKHQACISQCLCVAP